MNSLLILFGVLEPGSVLTAGGFVAFAAAGLLAFQAYRAKVDRLALAIAALAMLCSSAAFFTYVIEAAPEFTKHTLTSSVLNTTAYFLGICCTGLLFAKQFPAAFLVTLAPAFLIGYCIWPEGIALMQWKSVCQLISAIACASILIFDSQSNGSRAKIIGLILFAVAALGSTASLIVHSALELKNHYTSTTFKAASLLWAISPILGYACVVASIQSRITHVLKKSVDFDMLTGANSRRYLFDVGNKLIENRRRSEDFSSVILLIDLDHFKSINDKWGHDVGDGVLRHCVEQIQAVLRDTDTVVARYGGEEFCVILKGADAQKSLAMAERIRQSIADAPYQFKDQKIFVTASIGFAKAQREHSLSTLISVADQRLYSAKHLGRNQVVAA
jgi:diguanylate cyclase (GGDEF)-like protein